MLSPLAFKVLSDPDRISSTALRFFLRLLADRDLTKYSILSTVQLGNLYGLSSVTLWKFITELVQVGILEEGPVGRIPQTRHRVQTYRIRPAYLLTLENLEEYFRETQERQERETMVPV
jgi:hypothetical protein